MRWVIVFARTWVLRIAFALCRLLPVADRVVLASSHASRLSGNLAFIRAELERRGLADRTVVLTLPARRGVLGTLGAAFGDITAEYYLATSRVFIVDDYFFPIYVIAPRLETTILQTWHASGAFKKIGYSVLDKSFGASDALVSQVKIHSNYDAILLGSQRAVPAYAEAFGQPAERFVTDIGIPRTDLFFDAEKTAAIATAVHAKYKLPEGKRVILYAPTFRGDSKHAAAYHDDLDLALMRARCGDDWVLLLRLHPFVASEGVITPELAGFAIDASDHPDINELMLASDLLVTDYSSAIFEFALLERPMVFFAPDHERYEAERGFYFDYATGVPGPIFTTTEQVADYVAAGSFDTARVHAFRESSFEIADGHATERFVDRLVLPALGAVRQGGNEASLE
jgi:teichoic acid ribitol-phosphate primase